MQKRKSILPAVFAAASLLAGAAAFSADETRPMGQSDSSRSSDMRSGSDTSQSESRSAGQYIGDKALTARVKAAIGRAPDVRATDLSIETYNGVVQLSGFVDSRQQTEAAVSAARRTPGVRQVINSLQLKSEVGSMTGSGGGSSGASSGAGSDTDSGSGGGLRTR